MTENHSSATPLDPTSSPHSVSLGAIGWLWVGVPFFYGLVQLVMKIPALFNV